jgi:hypothetical protein
MIKQVQMYAGGAFGFAVALVWATLGLRAAGACLFAAGVGAGIAAYAQRRSTLDLSGRVSRVRTRVESITATARRPPEPKAKPRSSERRIGGYPATKQVHETTYGW